MSGAAMWPRAATCPRCGESALQRWRHERVGSRHCPVPKEWARNFMSGAILVRAEMALALREGRLEHYSKFKCVDCGAKAECYDHRDYSKPLDVDPVCRGCNVRRGAAKPKAWTLTEALEAFDGHQRAARRRGAPVPRAAATDGDGMYAALVVAYAYVNNPPAWARHAPKSN